MRVPSRCSRNLMLGDDRFEVFPALPPPSWARTSALRKKQTVALSITGSSPSSHQSIMVIGLVAGTPLDVASPGLGFCPVGPGLPERAARPLQCAGPFPSLARHCPDAHRRTARGRQAWSLRVRTKRNPAYRRHGSASRTPARRVIQVGKDVLELTHRLNHLFRDCRRDDAPHRWR